MRTFGPDASRYWLAAQGRRVAKPFNLRWLLPALCGDDLRMWWTVWALSWPLLAGGAAWWALGTGATWQVALASAALLVALPGVWGPHSVRPVGVDLPAMALSIWAAGCFVHGQPVIGMVVLFWAACVKESSPVLVALWAWTPWPLLMLVVPAVVMLVRRPEIDDVTRQPLLRRVHDHPVRSSIEHHRGQWRSAWFMVAPWGVGLAALLAPTPQLVVTVACAYGLLVVVTDTVRVYQAVAGPVVCLTAAAVVPPQWLLLAVVCHAVFWRDPIVG
jgi:hypothetical protein